jgi:hypothetical protein
MWLKPQRRKGLSRNKMSVCAISAEAYLLVMVDRVKGGGRMHPSPSTSWDEFTIMMECTAESSKQKLKLPIFAETYLLLEHVRWCTTEYTNTQYRSKKTECGEDFESVVKTAKLYTKNKNAENFRTQH